MSPACPPGPLLQIAAATRLRVVQFHEFGLVSLLRKLTRAGVQDALLATLVGDMVCVCVCVCVCVWGGVCIMYHVGRRSGVNVCVGGTTS